MLLSDVVDKSDLTRIIATLRHEMIQTGLKEGLTSNRTIEISEKLDEYIVKYQLIYK